MSLGRQSKALSNNRGLRAALVAKDERKTHCYMKIMEGFVPLNTLHTSWCCFDISSRGVPGLQCCQKNPESPEVNSLTRVTLLIISLKVFYYANENGFDYDYSEAVHNSLDDWNIYGCWINIEDMDS